MPRRTRSPTLTADGRARVFVSLTPDEAREVERAANGLPVATFARYALLRVARAVNGAIEPDNGDRS